MCYTYCVWHKICLNNVLKKPSNLIRYITDNIFLVYSGHVITRLESEMTKKRNVTLGLATFAVTLALTTIIAALAISTISSSRKERALFIATSIANRLEAEITAREYITRIFEIIIMGNNGKMSEKEFNTISEALYDDYLDVAGIAFAPDGIVNFSYPEDALIGIDTNLFAKTDLGIYSDYSKMSRLPVIIVPTEIAEGKDGIVIRRPVFLDEDTFWGFVSISFDMSYFLAEVNISELANQGYEYKLISNNSILDEKTVILEYSEKELTSPASALISTVGGNFWTLSIEPIDGWIYLYEVIAVLFIAFIISALAASFMYAYMTMKANAKELEILSYRDALTNLNNPRSYQEHMEDLSKKKLPYGLIFMDLNDFKKVNDTYGHEAGDALLNIVAKRLQNSIREKDKAFRIGGDEFVVVIHGTHDKKFFEGVIARMRQNVAREVTIGEISLTVSISAGYARCPEDGTKYEDVVKKADDAMYYNKRLMKARREQK